MEIRAAQALLPPAFLLAQLFLNLAAILLHVLFSGHAPKGNPEEQSRDPAWCRRAALSALISSALGLFFPIFLVR